MIEEMQYFGHLHHAASRTALMQLISCHCNSRMSLQFPEVLFEAFSGSTSAGGTGLGLAIAIAAELVHMHGGTIALEESESSAVFRIEI
jgi:nitrogen-specific signal transduction histidine kinase